MKDYETLKTHSILNPIVSKEYVIAVFDEILGSLNTITTGNCVHKVNSLRFTARFEAHIIRKNLGTIKEYDSLKQIAELLDKIKLGSKDFIHDINTIKRICRDNISYIKEFGL